MAYIQRPSPEDDNTELTGTSLPVESSVPMTSDAMASPAGNVSPTRQTGTGFTNLYRYLDANNQGAQNLGNKISDKIDTATDTAVDAFTPARNSFTSAINSGTNIFNPNAKEGDKEDLEGYRGPQSWAASNQAASLFPKVQQAQNFGAQAMDQYGRAQMLRNMDTRATMGGTNLNNFLVQNNQQAWNNVDDSADRAMDLTNRWDRTSRYMQGLVTRGQNTSRDTINRAQALQTQLVNQRLAREAAALEALANPPITVVPGNAIQTTGRPLTVPPPGGSITIPTMPFVGPVMGPQPTVPVSNTPNPGMYGPGFADGGYVDSDVYRRMSELANVPLDMPMPEFAGVGDLPYTNDSGFGSTGLDENGNPIQPGAEGESGSNPLSTAKNIYKVADKLFGGGAVAGTGFTAPASVPAVVTSLANTGLGAGAVGTGLTLGTAGSGLTAGAAGTGLAGTGLGAGAGSGAVAGAGGLAGGGLSTGSVGTATGLSSTGLGSGATGAATGSAGAGIGSLAGLGAGAALLGAAVYFGNKRAERKRAQRRAEWEQKNPGLSYDTFNDLRNQVVLGNNLGMQMGGNRGSNFNPMADLEFQNKINNDIIAAMREGRSVDGLKYERPTPPNLNAVPEFEMGGGAKDGGYISGPGTSRSDSIPARLSDGEYVIPAHVVDALGVGFFDKLLATYKGKK